METSQLLPETRGITLSDNLHPTQTLHIRIDKIVYHRDIVASWNASRVERRLRQNHRNIDHAIEHSRYPLMQLMHQTIDQVRERFATF